MVQATATASATSSRSLLDVIRNPSGATATLWVVVALVPFVWPISMYVVLRYATGHRAPGSRGPFPPDTTVGHHLRYPTVIEVVVIWVLGFFTLIGYVPAMYMTYRYLRVYVERKAPAKPGTLTGRLAELDTAHAAGLISEEEHQLKRRALLDTF
jgi:hypothetical protein